LYFVAVVFVRANYVLTGKELRLITENNEEL
jgi:hypothetical protein